MTLMHCAAQYENRQTLLCTKVLCILSGCPEGAREWHILFFAMLLHRKKRPAALAAGRQ